jgi:hypothetical protein
MSHENPYISRDVDIDAYVLQTDTAMNPYIVHMQTDASLVRIIPKSLRTETMQRGRDTTKREDILKGFKKKVDRLIQDMTKITAESNDRESRLNSQLD